MLVEENVKEKEYDQPCPVQPTQRQRLVGLRKILQEQLVDIDRALYLMEKHPDLEELTNLMRRI